jgi:hypothetical protein
MLFEVAFASVAFASVVFMCCRRCYHRVARLRRNGMDGTTLTMQIAVRFDGLCARRWHWSLLRRLADQPGIEVGIDPQPAHDRLPAAVGTLFQLETVLYGLPKPEATAQIALSEFDQFPRHLEPSDIIIDLCGDVSSEKTRVWKLTFNGEAGEPALLSLLLAGHTPLAEIVENGSVIAAGRVGTEYGSIAAASFEDIMSRTCTLIDAAVRGSVSMAPPTLPGEAITRQASPQDIPGLAAIGAKQLARAVIRRLYHLCFYSPHWRTGWRKLNGPDLIDLRGLESTNWQVLPDDGRRFYADPFPISREGQVTLFVEDYVHRVGKGIISAVTFGPDGPLGKPRPVMEQPVHLSYPFVFEQEGQFWMVPESSGANTVELFRASSFPGGWIKEVTLLEGITASDATIFKHNDRWWMFATVREGGGAFSDALHIWFAKDFRGPWTAHPRNPVLIDIASARPAGRVVRRNGTLVRPVQDCRRGYGAALGLARITRLDEESFTQTVDAILSPGAQWPGHRFHTLNSAGGLEFIDGSARASRWIRKGG